ncbi:unnamed protein product [Heterosigma akashiwo]|mmetsp:Transcript_2180/g.3651  ORF Transcript_2180/g.3651 Transcript_2180/m.3651 type:complete len:181 (-) Transcript_2180:280-822(-)
MMAERKSQEYEAPDFYHFPPFFTIQPNLATREKQLKLWKQFILGWHNHNKSYTLIPNEWEFFSNPSIQRSLSSEGRSLIIDHLIQSGNAEWEDDTKTRLRILWKTPEEVAAEFYDWIRERSMCGGVYTVWELTAGEVAEGSEWEGLDPALFRRALGLLEGQGKAQIFKGSTSNEDGVKFF